MLTDEARGPERVWVAGPAGRGGVSEVLDRVVPLLAPLGWVRACVDPLLTLLRTLAGAADPVLLHTSLRPRAFARDTLVHAVGRGPTAVAWHGWDPVLADRIDRERVVGAVFSRGLGRADVHGVLTDTQAAALVRWGVPADRVHRLVNPVDPGLAPRGSPAPGPPTVLFLGRLVAAKGVVELVRAFDLAARSHPDLRLVLAGDGPARPDVVRALGAIASADRVSLAGWVGPTRRRTLLAQAAVLALPSRSESSPVAVAEALAAGVPVVATRVGAVAELVGAAGVILDDPGDPGPLADALVALVDRPPPALAEVGARVRADGAPERVAASWQALVASARTARG